MFADVMRAVNLTKRLQPTAVHFMHVYKVRPRKDKRGFDLISAALPFGRLRYDGPQAVANAIGYAKFYSRSRQTVISVFDSAGNIIETHEHVGEFKDL